MITFEWKTGTAADAMQKALKKYNIDIYYRFFAPHIRIKDQEVKIDYKPLKNDLFEIVQKIGCGSEAIYKSIEI